MISRSGFGVRWNSFLCSTLGRFGQRKNLPARRHERFGEPRWRSPLGKEQVGGEGGTDISPENDSLLATRQVGHPGRCSTTHEAASNRTRPRDCSAGGAAAANKLVERLAGGHRRLTPPRSSPAPTGRRPAKGGRRRRHRGHRGRRDDRRPAGGQAGGGQPAAVGRGHRPRHAPATRRRPAPRRPPPPAAPRQAAQPRASCGRRRPSRSARASGKYAVKQAGKAIGKAAADRVGKAIEVIEVLEKVVASASQEAAAKPDITPSGPGAAVNRGAGRGPARRRPSRPHRPGRRRLDVPEPAPTRRPRGTLVSVRKFERGPRVVVGPGGQAAGTDAVGAHGHARSRRPSRRRWKSSSKRWKWRVTEAAATQRRPRRPTPTPSPEADGQAAAHAGGGSERRAGQEAGGQEASASESRRRAKSAAKKPAAKPKADTPGRPPPGRRRPSGVDRGRRPLTGRRPQPRAGRRRRSRYSQQARCQWRRRSGASRGTTTRCPIPTAISWLQPGQR